MKKGRALALAFAPGEIQDGLIREATVAVVDVLRATSVIPQAFAAGAMRVIPAESVEQATALLASLDRESTLLCGEREGKKIPGFHLGNSPLEYDEESVGGKTLIFSSTNGSRAMIRCLAAPEQVLASFVNASRAAERLEKSDRDLVIICSGEGGRSCLEDTVMGGYLVERILEDLPGVRPDDGALMARSLWRQWKVDVGKLLRTASHGVYLSAEGFGDDLEFCARMDAVDVVPLLKNGRIELERDVRETPAVPGAEG